MGPLAGYRILELAGIGPTPFAGMMLGDMGADVIVVERASAPEGSSPPKNAGRRNRRSIALNLKQAGAVDALLTLCETAHALIEGYRPGVAERLGIGPDRVLARNPKLIYGRMTGWGQDGPLAHKAGHDINYISLSGVLEKVGRKGDRPVPPLNLVGDYGGGGMMLAFGVVCALLEAEKSGKGQVIDASMVDGSAALMAFLYAFEVEESYRPYKDRGTQLFGGNNHYYNTYETKDGKYVSVGALEQQFYRQLVERSGVDRTLFEDQWLGSPTGDVAKIPELEKEMARVFKTKTRDEWCDVFEDCDACFAPVLSLQEAPDHPHNKARRTFMELDGLVQHSPAPRFSRTIPAKPRIPRVAGEDTEAVLIECGFSRDRIAELKENRAIS